MMRFFLVASSPYCCCFIFMLRAFHSQKKVLYFACKRFHTIILKHHDMAKKTALYCHLASQFSLNCTNHNGTLYIFIL